MKNSKESTKETKKTRKNASKKRNVFGKELSKAPNELQLILEACESLVGVKGITYNDVLNKVIELRPTSKFALKPNTDLTRKTRQNFVNRIAKTLGSTRLSAQLNPSLQAKKFNIELQTRLKVKFEVPIDPSANISPQVKQEGQSFEIIGKREFLTSDIKATKSDIKKFESFKARFKK